MPFSDLSVLMAIWMMGIYFRRKSDVSRVAQISILYKQCRWD
jgi:hypothetical protein